MSKRMGMIVAAAGLFLSAPAAVWAQPRPYIGYVYPAGGQQGTTFQIKLGGQGLDNVDQVLVTGGGVEAHVLAYYRRLNNQETQLLNEQMKELRDQLAAKGIKPPSATPPTSGAATAPKPADPPAPPPNLTEQDKQALEIIDRIQARFRENVNTPACDSIANLVFVEVTIAPDAAPGLRELRLATPRGVSNPLVFHVGQLPEFSRKAMTPSLKSVLGKEELAQRKRPPEEVEQQVTVPCTLNGQIAAGEVNWYRFSAKKGQRLVVTTLARQLIPYIADAVPGWFQPVVAVYDANRRELAFNDDFRFKPDPTLLFDVPADGEYLLSITDALYRGREDWVYRLSISELPFVTSIFPLGGSAGALPSVSMKGWNLNGATLDQPPANAAPGIHWLCARAGGKVSNAVPFAVDNLPECLEKEPNDPAGSPQKVALPMIVNGRIDRPDDWDVFEFEGRAGDVVVAEVLARRLDSPVDSFLKLTDASGKLLAFNDDREDPGSGLNTHHADSYLMCTLPADGVYRVHLGEAARHGGEEFGYRLRLSPPRPDFELRMVPSSAALRGGNGSATLMVHAIRKDGFTGPIKLALKDPPEGFTASPTTLAEGKDMVGFTLRTTLPDLQAPVALRVEGTAAINGQDVAHEAVPAEDRMQAFLWRHLVPAEDLQVIVYDPNVDPAPRRDRRGKIPKK